MESWAFKGSRVSLVTPRMISLLSNLSTVPCTVCTLPFCSHRAGGAEGPGRHSWQAGQAGTHRPGGRAGPPRAGGAAGSEGRVREGRARFRRYVATQRRAASSFRGSSGVRAAHRAPRCSLQASSFYPQVSLAPPVFPVRWAPLESVDPKGRSATPALPSTALPAKTAERASTASRGPLVTAVNPVSEVGSNADGSNGTVCGRNAGDLLLTQSVDVVLRSEGHARHRSQHHRPDRRARPPWVPRRRGRPGSARPAWLRRPQGSSR